MQTLIESKLSNTSNNKIQFCLPLKRNTVNFGGFLLLFLNRLHKEKLTTTVVSQTYLKSVRHVGYKIPVVIWFH